MANYCFNAGFDLYTPDNFTIGKEYLESNYFFYYFYL